MGKIDNTIIFITDIELAAEGFEQLFSHHSDPLPSIVQVTWGTNLNWPIVREALHQKRPIWITRPTGEYKMHQFYSLFSYPDSTIFEVDLRANRIIQYNNRRQSLEPETGSWADLFQSLFLSSKE